MGRELRGSNVSRHWEPSFSDAVNVEKLSECITILLSLPMTAQNQLVPVKQLEQYTMVVGRLSNRKLKVF